jgi:hypothetical protein
LQEKVISKKRIPLPNFEMTGEKNIYFYFKLGIIICDDLEKVNTFLIQKNKFTVDFG